MIAASLFRAKAEAPSSRIRPSRAAFVSGPEAVTSRNPPVGGAHDTLCRFQPAVLIAVQAAFGDGAGEIESVVDAEVHAHAADRGMDVGGIARQPDAAATETVDAALAEPEAVAPAHRAQRHFAADPRLQVGVVANGTEATVTQGDHEQRQARIVQKGRGLAVGPGPVHFGVEQGPVALIGHPFEFDAQASAGNAMRPVGAQDKVGLEDLTVIGRDRRGAVVLPDLRGFCAPENLDTARLGQSGEDRFGAALGQCDHGRRRRVGLRDIERGERAAIAEKSDALQRGRRVQDRPGRAHRIEMKQAAAVDADGAGFADGVLKPFQHPDCMSAPGKRQRCAQPGGAGADHDDAGMRAGHAGDVGRAGLRSMWAPAAERLLTGPAYALSSRRNSLGSAAG
nr:hypothetical protein [Minwuia thermotolerans]